MDLDLDAAAEVIEKAVGGDVVAAAKKKANQFLADHKKKENTNGKGKGTDTKIDVDKKMKTATKKNKDNVQQGEEEEKEEVVEINSVNTNSEEEEEFGIPENLEEVQDYLSDMWEDIKGLGNDPAIQDQIQTLKDSDEVQAQIAHLQSLGDDPDIRGKIEELQKGLDHDVREEIESVERGVREVAGNMEKRHVYHQKGKGVQQYHEHHHRKHHENDRKAAEAADGDGIETDIDDVGSDAKMEGQAAAKKSNKKHQRQKGGTDKDAVAVRGGVQNRNRHAANKNKHHNNPPKKQGHGKQGGHKHGMKGGIAKNRVGVKGKGKKHHRVAKKHVVKKKGKGAVIREGRPGAKGHHAAHDKTPTPPASAPLKNKGQNPADRRHRHFHHHQKHHGGRDKGARHPGAGSDSGPDPVLPGGETKSYNHPVHTVPKTPPITLPVQVPFKDVTPTEPTTQNRQKPPSLSSPETPKKPVVNQIVSPTTPSPKPITQEPNIESPKSKNPVPPSVQEPSNPTETVVESPSTGPEDKEVEQQPPKTKEAMHSPVDSPPAPVQEEQRPANIVVVAPDVKPAEIETPSTPQPKVEEKVVAAKPPKTVADEKMGGDDRAVTKNHPPPSPSSHGDDQSAAKKPKLPIVVPLPPLPPIPHPEPSPSPSPTTGEVPKPADTIPGSEPGPERVRKPVHKSLPVVSDSHPTDPVESPLAPASPVAIPDVPVTPVTPAPANDRKPDKDDENEDNYNDDDDNDDDYYDDDDDEDDEDVPTSTVGQRITIDHAGNLDKDGGDEGEVNDGSAEEATEQDTIGTLNQMAENGNTAPDEHAEGNDADDESEVDDWGEYEDDGGNAFKAQKTQQPVVGVDGTGLSKRQIPAIRVFGVNGAVADTKAVMAIKNDLQQQQKDEKKLKAEREGKKNLKVEKEDKMAQRQHAVLAVAEPIVKAEGRKKMSAVDQKDEGKDKRLEGQGVEGNVIAKGAKNKYLKDDHHQQGQRQQQQQDQQVQRQQEEEEIETQAGQKEKKQNKKNKKQHQKEVEKQQQEQQDDDDFVEDEMEDIKNEDDTEPGPPDVDDDAGDFGEYDNTGKKKGKMGKKEKKEHKKKNHLDDDENVVYQDQSIIAADESAAAAVVVNPFEVEAAKAKKNRKKHKKHKNHHQNQDDQAATFQTNAAVYPFGNNKNGFVHKKGIHKTNFKDRNSDDQQHQQRQDDKSKNDNPGSTPALPPPSINSKDTKAMPGTPPSSVSGGGVADRKAPSGAVSPAGGGGSLTPPKEAKSSGGNGYGSVPMFGPAQLDLGSGGMSSLRLVTGRSQWIASLSAVVLTTVFMYL
ncbi:hypothetical protein BGZ96_010966 [Linnemannia gamsii]|uniref:Uncharacterized protein n=1 Tax=Linnemannia gamsii TaxID=64522 RepID=A0ABQ7JU11_9FUNG|nr:hypothetical protein BGZ96_010966 [Linnemannia gamsii]